MSEGTALLSATAPNSLPQSGPSAPAPPTCPQASLLWAVRLLVSHLLSTLALVHGHKLAAGSCTERQLRCEAFLPAPLQTLQVRLVVLWLRTSQGPP